MIDKKLLSSLGWSAELIDEVNRVSSEVEQAVAGIRPFSEPAFNYGVGTTKLYVSENQNNTMPTIFINKDL